MDTGDRPVPRQPGRVPGGEDVTERDRLDTRVLGPAIPRALSSPWFGDEAMGSNHAPKRLPSCAVGIDPVAIVVRTWPDW